MIRYASLDQLDGLIARMEALTGRDAGFDLACMLVAIARAAATWT